MIKILLLTLLEFEIKKKWHSILRQKKIPQAVSKALVAIANTYTTMKVVDVNKENQIKSNFYNFNEERSIFVLKEIWQNNNLLGRRGGEWGFAFPIPAEGK